MNPHECLTSWADIFRLCPPCRPLTCSSDEYYMPTLLAMSGLEAQTTCHGSVVQVPLVPFHLKPARPAAAAVKAHHDAKRVY